MRPHLIKSISTVLLLTGLCLGFALRAHAQATLTHRYSFQDPAGSSTFADSVGGVSWDGTLVPNGGNPQLTGTSMVLDGDGDYAALPTEITTNYTQLTVEFWVDVNASNPDWTRVFFFGDQTGGGTKNSGVDYCPLAPGNYQNLDYLSTNGVDIYANSNPGIAGTTNEHVTVVVDPVNNVLAYYNGTGIVSIQHGTLFPLNEFNDTYNVIGLSPADLDPTLAATFHEFRVYSGAITQSAVALNDAVGSGNYVTNPGAPLQLFFGSPVDPVTVNQSVQQTLTGNFTEATNLNLILYGGVTYASANTNVLTISSSGVVKGVAVGTTTITATYGSLSATNTITVQSLPTALVHEYSFNGNVNDSVGTANGALQGDASVASGQLVLDGGGYLSLPANIINIATNAAVTFEVWTTIGATAEWSHIFEFGNPTVNNIYCAPRADAGGFHSFGLSQGGGTGGQTISWAHGWSNITMHFTGVVDPTTGTLAEYTNGVLVAASYNDFAPWTVIGTNNATLGQSSYGDPNATLTIDEFRIYNGALTPAQIAMSDASGPDTVDFNPGTLNSITVVATNYPAFSELLAPVVIANYSALGNFNMVPNPYAIINGLTVTSSNPNIISVNGANMLTTYRPGTVTLTATYLGKTSSATVRVCNQSVLTHRYTFTNNGATSAVDSVSGANGTLVGTANISGGQLQLDGGSGDYVALPGGLVGNYRSATMDIWTTISSGQQHWARLWEFADVGPATANELYWAPAWNGGANQTFFSDGMPFGGNNIGPLNPASVNETVHLTCLIGDGTMDMYTNGAFWATAGISAPASQAGTSGSWIGYSPYGDPGIDGTVAEYRIYQGRLSPEEIEASDYLGPSAPLSTTNAVMTAAMSGGNTLLSWPPANAGFAVEVTSSLSPPITWTTLTNAPSLVSGNWQLSLPAGAGPQYYRLIR